MTEEWEYADLVGKLEEIGISLEGLRDLKQLPPSIDAEIDKHNFRKSVNLLKKGEARHFIRRFATKVLKFYDQRPWAEDIFFEGLHFGTKKLSTPKTSTTSTVLMISCLSRNENSFIGVDRVYFSEWHPLEVISGKIMDLPRIEDRRRIREEFNLHASARRISIL